MTIFPLIANEFETFTVMNRIYFPKSYYFTKVVWLIAKNLPDKLKPIFFNAEDAGQGRNERD